MEEQKYGDHNPVPRAGKTMVVYIKVDNIDSDIDKLQKSLNDTFDSMPENMRPSPRNREKVLEINIAELKESFEMLSKTLSVEQYDALVSTDKKYYVSAHAVIKNDGSLDLDNAEKSPRKQYFG